MVLTKENKVVLVEQYRHGGEDFFLEIPAGKIEGNETNEEGIEREVREETEYISKMKPIKLGEFMVNPSTQNNKVITYLLVDAVKEYEQNLDDLEEIDTTLVDFDKLGELLKTNHIKKQLFTANAYFMAKDYLLRNEA
ncbi:NUDIX hydrolase [Bacillus sp. JCM 19034]|uniref:NUDIX hydrolase n=1 Tax=Bacillus sp. JCM 19034 TaxID=1481928 RepID=UPI0022B168CD|nr:NUDIX hydrolase [Bacillus sp. JCM 19034]